MHLGGVRWPGWDDYGFLQYMLPPWKAETTQRWYPQQVASHICTRTSRWKAWNLCNSKFRYWISVDKTQYDSKTIKSFFWTWTVYIYIYMYKKHLPLADVWQTLKSDSLILQHPRSLCLSYELHKYIQWLDESGSHRCPTWWTAWKGRCSPTWWWCNCPGSQVFFW